MNTDENLSFEVKNTTHKKEHKGGRKAIPKTEQKTEKIALYVTTQNIADITDLAHSFSKNVPEFLYENMTNLIESNRDRLEKFRAL